MREKKQRSRPRYQERLTALFLLLMALVYPLWITGNYQTITEQKFSCFLALAGGYVLLMAVLGLELLAVGQARCPSPKALWARASLPQKLVVAYALCTLASAALSPFGGETLWGMSRSEGLVTQLLYCGMFLLVSVFGRADRRLLYALGLSVSVASAVGLLQLAGWNPLGLYPAGLTYYDAGSAYFGAYLSTIGNVDLLAAFLCAAVPLFAGTLARRRDRERLVLLIPLVLALTLLLWMRVAAGIVGVLGAALVLCPALSVTPRRRKRLALASLALALGGLTAVYALGGRVGGTVGEFSRLLHGQVEDSFGSGRVYIWKQVAGLVPERLWFGGGPDTLAARVSGYFQRYDAATGLTLRSLIDTAHCEYLNILVNQGLLALLAYLGALAASAVRWLRRAPVDTAAAVLGGGVLCYGIQALFGISSFITAPALWLVWGLLEQRLSKKEEDG